MNIPYARKKFGGMIPLLGLCCHLAASPPATAAEPPPGAGGARFQVLSYDWCEGRESSALQGYLGARLVSQGGEVTLTVSSAETAVNSDFYLLAPGSPRFLASNRANGMFLKLGSYPAGTEIVLGLQLRDMPYRFVTGSGARNPDEIPHDLVLPLDRGGVLVGFEDNLHGGDEDYNDARITVQGVTPVVDPAPPDTRFCVERDIKPSPGTQSGLIIAVQVEMDRKPATRPVDLKVSAHYYGGAVLGPEERQSAAAILAHNDETPGSDALSSQSLGILTDPIHQPDVYPGRDRGKSSTVVTSEANGRAVFEYLFQKQGSDLIRVTALNNPETPPIYLLITWGKDDSPAFNASLPPRPPLTGIPLPRTIRFLEPLSDLEVLPTVRSRSYIDTRNQLRLYPFTERMQPRQFRLQVLDGDAPPVKPARVRITLKSSDGEAGHGAHPGPRVHGWLFETAEEMTPLRGKPLRSLSGAGASARSKGNFSVPKPPDISKESGPTPTIETPSVGETGRHSAETDSVAVDRNEPGGEPNALPLDLWTDPFGGVSFYYLPPEISGVDVLKAEALQSPDAAPVSRTITVRQNGLMELERSKEIPWFLIRTKSHDRAHSLEPVTAERLKQAALLYANRQAKDAELQKCLLDLSASGYDFPFNTAKNRILTAGAEPLMIESASLPWGGLLDTNGDYASSAWGHRDGQEVDLMTRHLVRGNPLKASLPAAIGDSQLEEAGDTKRDTLVKLIHFRRLQLLIAALKEMGGQFLPEEAGFDEGLHLHVSFGPVPVQTPPAVETPEKPVMPLTPGLKPANPNQKLP